MKTNQNTKIVSKRVILVPYEDFHVPKYHEWMKSKELQELTASEPLSLLEEYAMQKSWREDDDKCTFIILDKMQYEHSLNEVGWYTSGEDIVYVQWKLPKVCLVIHSLFPESMIGDTNLFFNGETKHEAEIEVMIAEKSARGKGYGWESTVAMLVYGIDNLNVTTFRAKIAMSNAISLKMFNKLGFKDIEKSDVFREVTLEKHVTPEWKEWILTGCDLEIAHYIDK